MKNIRVFLTENFQFLEVKFSIYLNRHVFVMKKIFRTESMQTTFGREVGNHNLFTLVVLQSK